MKHLFIILLIFTIFQPGQNDNSYLSTQDIMGESYISKFFTNFLKKFRGFHIIFHSTSANIFYVSNVVRYINVIDDIHDKSFAYSSLLIYNHDFFDEEDFQRPQVSKMVHVLFDFDRELWKFLATPKTIKSSDVLVFVSSEELGERLKVYGEDLLKLAGNTLLVHTKPTAIDIFKTCYFCGEDSKKFHLLESTTDIDTHIRTKLLLPSDFRDLNGHTLHAVFISYFPVISCDENVTQPLARPARNVSPYVCTSLGGIEGLLMRALGHKLNFRPVVHCMAQNALFFNMVELVHAGEMDIGFGGISVTAERIPLVQFTKVYNFEEFNFLYLFDLTFQEIFGNFMAPFSAGLVWSLYFAAFLALSITLYVALNIGVENNYSGISFTNSLWSVRPFVFSASEIAGEMQDELSRSQALLHVVIEQSNPYIARVYRQRAGAGLVLAVWWTSSLVVSTMYKSLVLSAMVYPPNMEPQDIESIVRAGYRIAGNAQFADILTELLDVQDPLYRQALRRTMYGENTCDVFAKMLQGHIAMLDEQSTIQYEVRTACARPDDAQIQLLRMCRKAVRATGHAWATQPGAPYTPAINHYLSLIFSAGLFKKWTRDVTLKLAKNQIRWAREKQSGEIKTLSLKRFLPLLSVYAIGIAASSAAFLAELLYWRFKIGNYYVRFLCDFI